MRKTIAKKSVIVLLCILLVPLMVFAPKIEVKVKGNIGGNIEYFEMNKIVNSVQEFRIQWYNSESVGCRSRLEFKIFNETGYIDSVWSGSKKMLPGLSDSFNAYWIPEHRGNYSVKIIIHHCHEIIESEMMNFSVESLPEPETDISIKAKNLPDKKIEVTLRPKKDLENVIISPNEYPLGWIFSGKKIDILKAGEETVKIIEYEPSVWSENLVNLRAVSLDGKHSSEKISFALKEEKYFWDKYGYGILLLTACLLTLSLMANLYLILKYKKAGKYT